MSWLSTNYNKAVIMGLTILVAVGPQILAQSAALGITPIVANWISVGVGIGGTVLTILTGNKNQPTLPPGHVVVAQNQVLPNAPIVARHRP